MMLDINLNMIRTSMTQATLGTQYDCSHKEIVELRRLVLASPFIKDLGMIRHGMLFCSSTLGKVEPNHVHRGKAQDIGKGLRLFWKTPVVMTDGSKGYVLTTDRVSAVVGDRMFRGFLPEGVEYKLSPSSFSTSSSGLCQPLTRQQFCAVIILTDAISRRIESNARTLAIISGLFFPFMSLLAIGFIRRSRRNSSFVIEFREAIRTGKLTIHYQPIVRVTDSRVVAAEALLRWPGSPISTESIIKKIEASGLAHELTRYVFDVVENDMKIVDQAGYTLNFTINLPPSEYESKVTYELFTRLSVRTRDRIAIELTERTTTQIKTLKDAISRWRSVGIDTYLDDFGTGYSNLALLDGLQIDGIKVDRSLTRQMHQGSITHDIIEFAIKNDIKVILEGIESEEQRFYLSYRYPNVFAQGWLYGRPDTLERLLETMRLNEIAT